MLLRGRGLSSERKGHAQPANLEAQGRRSAPTRRRSDTARTRRVGPYLANRTKARVPTKGLTMRLKNCLRLLTAIAGVATLATSATAYGAATPGTFYIPVSSHETGLTGDCFGGVNGTLDGTSVFSGHNVVTPSGFGSLHGAEVSQVRIVYDNGITFVGGSTDHFAVEQTTSTGTG